ncbi:MAG: beta-galactosidase trimerization domain-containing protein [Caldilineaceae bacterium]|nr:beta-galactosidase trimerization domain-containing protein [Caldilineaceae bacterium]
MLDPNTVHVHLHPDMHTPDWDPRFMREADAEQIAELAARAGGTVFWAFAKCVHGSAYYPTRAGHQHETLAGRDLLAEVIAALRAREIASVIYYCTCNDTWAADRNPDWSQRNSEGAALPEVSISDFPWTCLNSPYRQRVLGQLQELAEGYDDAVGIFLDRVDWGPGGCYCNYCQRAFRIETGHPLPTREQWQTRLGRTFMQWRSRVLHEFLREAQALVKVSQPDWAFSHNVYPETREIEWVGQWPERDVPIDDEVLVEAFGDYTFEWMRNATYARALTSRRPIISFGRFVGPMWDWTTKPRAHLMAQCLTPLANGCDPMMIDSFYPDGSLDPAAYADMAPVSAAVRARSPWCVEADPLRYAAVHLSLPTRLYYADDRPAAYLHDFNGAFKALADGHLLTDIALGRDLTADRLGDYRVLVLPNAACLSDDQVEAIAQYVERGGGLVATHSTSLYDEQGNRRGDFGLREVFGVSYREALNFNTSFLQLGQGSVVGEGLPSGTPLSLATAQWKVEARGGTETAASVVLPLIDYSIAPRRITWGDPPPEMPTSHPAVTNRQHGKGRVVYFAGLPERAYFQRHYIHCRHLLLNAVRWAAAAGPPVALVGSAGLKLTAFRQRFAAPGIPAGRQEKAGSRLVVHIVNLQAVPGHDVRHGRIEGAGQLNWANPIEEITPAHDLMLRIAAPSKPNTRVYTAPDGEELDFEVEDGEIRVRIPTVHYHTMVVVE